MTPDGRTKRAISITRTALKAMLANSATLIQMTGLGVTPDQVEETILDILEYLTKTQSKELKEEDE